MLFRKFLLFVAATSTSELHPLSLHDALPISEGITVFLVEQNAHKALQVADRGYVLEKWPGSTPGARSEEHTSELQSRGHLVCRLLLEKKNISTRTGYDIP